MAPPIFGGRVSGLSWKLSRLRTMGGREISHRVLRWGFQKLEKPLIDLGYAPKPRKPVTTRQILFPQWESWLDQWNENYQLDLHSLDELLQGKIGFFGHPPIDIGIPTQWSRDPLTHTIAPLKYGKSIDYRDDSLVGNIKFTWELGRHQHLIPLAVAYAVTGEERYKNYIVDQIETWISQNPYGKGIHWCSALELALRLIAWSVVHSLIATRDGPDGLFLASRDKEKLGDSIYCQAYFIRHYLSLYSSANNHLIGELAGLWTVCQVFDLGTMGEKWGNFAKQKLEKEAQLQIFGDGVNKEQAIYYHLWVLEYLLFVWLIGVRCGHQFSPDFVQRITLMTRFLHDVTPANGTPPQIGDADDGFVTRFEPEWPSNPYAEVLVAAEMCVENSISETTSAQLPQKAFWYGQIIEKSLNKITERSTAKSDRSYPKIYNNGGYAILGNQNMHLVFDAGSLGYPSIAAHGHADALSFCLAIDSQWWLVDPGTYAYHSDPKWRDYFRSTSAHNTLVVDEQNQSQMGGPFLWVRHAKAIIENYGSNKDNTQWVVGRHDGYHAIGITHRRTVTLGVDTVDIIDEIVGEGEHELSVYFHFAPEVKLEQVESGKSWIATMTNFKHQLYIEVDLQWDWKTYCGSEEPILGWYSPKLNQKIPATTLVGYSSSKTPLKLETKLVLK